MESVPVEMMVKWFQGLSVDRSPMFATFVTFYKP
jgi:hypothetical protein